MKRISSYLKSTPSNLSNCKILVKTKMSKFGTKNALFGYFWLEFEKNIVIFEISSPEFVKLQNFVKKWKCLNVGQKMPCLGIFASLKIFKHLKTILSYLKPAPSNLHNWKIWWNNENAYIWEWKCLIWY